MAGKLTGKIIDYAVTFTVTTIGQAVGMKVCLGYMGEDLVEAFKEKLARSRTTK